MLDLRFRGQVRRIHVRILGFLHSRNIKRQSESWLREGSVSRVIVEESIGFRIVPAMLNNAADSDQKIQ